MNQFNMTSDDLKNLLGPAHPRLLACAERMLNLIPNDIGRPIAYIRAVTVVRDLEQTVAQVISSATPHEGRVHSTDGFWYTMRVVPTIASSTCARGSRRRCARTRGG